MRGLSFLENLRTRSKTGEAMWMFVGLGNPGREYEQNRHNVGFLVVDAIRDAFPAIPDFRKKFQGVATEGNFSGQKTLLLKPQTYMNVSGESVQPAAQFYKIPAERIFVFHDELDLKAGEVRVKKGGGNAGHNGLKSIQQHLGTPDFWRIRIGIGRPEHKGDVSDYVLGNFSKNEEAGKNQVIEKLAAHVALLLSAPKDYESKVN